MEKVNELENLIEKAKVIILELQKEFDGFGYADISLDEVLNDIEDFKNNNA